MSSTANKRKPHKNDAAGEHVVKPQAAPKKKKKKPANRHFLEVLKKILITILCIAASAGAIFAGSYYLCTIETVHVEGSEVYTDEEIAAYVLDDEYSWNAVYAMLKSFFQPEYDIPLVESVTVYMNGLHDITISVTEKDYRCVMEVPATNCPQLDYIRSLTAAEDQATEERKAEAAARDQLQEAFDAAVAEGEIKVDPAGNVIDDEGNPVDTGEDVLTWYADQLAQASALEAADGDGADTDDTADTDDAADTDVTADTDATADAGADSDGAQATEVTEETTEPMYAYIDAEGNVLDVTSRYVELPTLYVENAGDLQAGDKVSADDDIVELYVAILEKLDVLDTDFTTIILTEDADGYIIHDAIIVSLGDIDEIAQKMRRIDYIMPYIEGRFGILHMENWTQSNKDIIFQILE